MLCASVHFVVSCSPYKPRPKKQSAVESYAVPEASPLFIKPHESRFGNQVELAPVPEEAQQDTASVPEVATIVELASVPEEAQQLNKTLGRCFLSTRLAIR